MALRTFHFYDELARIIGHESLDFDADTPLLLISALRHQVPGFSEAANKMQIGFMIRGEDGEFNSPVVEQFVEPFGDSDEVHVIADVAGSGIETAIAAFASFVGVSVATATFILQVAASVVLGAIAGALAPQPSMGGEAAEKKESFIFSGVQNVTEQGHPIPLVYGTFLVGSVVVSADVLVDEERLEAPTPPTSPAPEPLWEAVYLGGGF